jgi:hypothetical protein
MLAHQVAGKAFRDAAFLDAWPATALPAMTVACALLTLALVPLFSQFLSRFAATTVVSVGFAISAAGHGLEWEAFDRGRWVVIVIYLHLACVGAVLLSGFWSLIAERFDPAGARTSYGSIAAAGTAGGIIGSIAAARMSMGLEAQSLLILLAALHLLCAGGVLLLGRSPALLPPSPAADASMSTLRLTLGTPYLRTIAIFVVLTSASTAIVDFLLKSTARASLGAGPELLRFFAVFYGSLQVLSFFAQTRSGQVLQRLGMGATINTLPAGVGVVGLLTLLSPGWMVLTSLRGVEAVVRNSLFRSGYELLFVPMDAAMRHRAKAFLDVVCDRVGEAAGSGLVQLILLMGIASTTRPLLAITVALAIASIWVGRGFGALYLWLIEHQLLRYRESPHVSLVSEAGWTVLQVPGGTLPTLAAPEVAARSVPVPPGPSDQHIALMTELRSADAARVTAALAKTPAMTRAHVAQVIDLLAWNDVLPVAGGALETLATSHAGMLIDALLDPSTDFAIRRRLPRILGTVATARSLDGLLDALHDTRFEVRYHCSRAIARVLAANHSLSIDTRRMIAAIERELMVPPQRWRGYRLLDRADAEENAAEPGASVEPSSHYLEHIFKLLSTIVSREPLDAAVQGVRSPNPGIRGLAVEYLDQVLPPAVLERLKEIIASTTTVEPIVNREL